MASSGAIPQVGTKGVFTVKEPYTLSNEIEYEVAAVRTVQELLAEKFDILSKVYLPVGLSKEDYEADVFAGAVIINLVSKSTKPLYIPTTYILGFPDLDSVPYSDVLCGIELGPLADTYDLTAVQEVITSAVTSKLGITPTIQFAKIPTTGIISRSQHEALMAARQGLITDADTDYANRLAAEQRNEALIQENEMLKQLLLDSGYLDQQTDIPDPT